MTTNEKLEKAKILKIIDILKQDLKIPSYQRPYKWEVRHVQQLLSDLLQNFNKQRQVYRIGTVVLHQEENQLSIVDGQQRLTTLTLLLKHLTKTESESYLSLLKQEYKHTTSQENIIKNNYYIKTFLLENNLKLNNEFNNYILTICEMVCITLNNLDEAFQFFDSQNARGKRLEAYDLLKAYHLRAMQDKEQELIYKCVTQWEAASLQDEQSPNLHKIINQILFRLRSWQISQSGEQFSSNELKIFKGVSEQANFPYLQATLASHALAKIANKNPLLFKPQYAQANFQAKQTIIDGEWFFAYIEHYRHLYQHLFDTKKGILSRFKSINNIKIEENLISFLNSHKHCQRTGDRYLRNLFECVIMAYFDKFGDDCLEAFINKAFIWVYRIRAELSRITFASIDNTAIDTHGLFIHIDRSCIPDDVMLFINQPKITQKFTNFDEKIKEILGLPTGDKNG